MANLKQNFAHVRDLSVLQQDVKNLRHLCQYNVTHNFLNSRIEHFGNEQKRELKKWVLAEFQTRESQDVYRAEQERISEGLAAKIDQLRDQLEEFKRKELQENFEEIRREMREKVNQEVFADYILHQRRQLDLKPNISEIENVLSKIQAVKTEVEESLANFYNQNQKIYEMYKQIDMEICFRALKSDLAVSNKEIRTLQSQLETQRQEIEEIKQSYSETSEWKANLIYPKILASE